MIKGLRAMLSQGGEDNCIQEAIQQIEQHVNCIVRDPSYEIPVNVFRLRQAQFKVIVQSDISLNTKQSHVPHIQDKHNAKRKEVMSQMMQEK